MEERDLIKIAVLGAESSGKSWLCERLAAHFRTAWTPEFAREYFHDSDIYNYTLQDLVNIAQEQLRLEEEKSQEARRILFCDTTLITLKIWAELEFQICPPYIEEKLHASHYDLYLITSNEVPWQQDPLRQNKHSRELLLQMNLDEVAKTNAPYFIIEGRNEERLKRSVEVIGKFLELR